MYSFSSSTVWKNQKFGLPIVPIKDMSYIANNLNAVSKIPNASFEEVKDFWAKNVKLSRNHGCVEEVYFKFNIK